MVTSHLYLVRGSCRGKVYFHIGHSPYHPLPHVVAMSMDSIKQGHEVIEPLTSSLGPDPSRTSCCVGGVDLYELRPATLIKLRGSCT